MGNLYALRGAYLQQLRVLVTPDTLATPLIIAVPLVATLAWIGSQSPNTEPLAYISVGVFRDAHVELDSIRDWFVSRHGIRSADP